MSDPWKLMLDNKSMPPDVFGLPHWWRGKRLNRVRVATIWANLRRVRP